MGLREKIIRQFKRPEGVLGGITGWIMATRPSNRHRNLWTVNLLGIRPSDRVLEFGCGPGVAVKTCAEQATEGLTVGLDHSELMLARAARLNRHAIERNLVQLRLGGLDCLPTPGACFDRVFSVNVIQFLPGKATVFHALYQATAPGGILATTYQPRHRNPTRADAIHMADEIKTHMAAAGFEEVRTEELQLRPVPAICVLGRKADRDSEGPPR